MNDFRDRDCDLQRRLADPLTQPFCDIIAAR
jgi:hypothetical protein